MSNFDKGGAIKMVQQIVYEKYPNHWYLILDSDIILPNNFIDILIKEDLNEECIYGAIRNNIVKTESKFRLMFSQGRMSHLHPAVLPAH